MLPLAAIACGGLGAATSTGPSAGAARVRTDTTFYDVTGRTPRDWLVAMHANAPAAGVRPPFQALTEWFTRYSYPSSRLTPRGCAAVAPQVELQLRFYFPRLRADPGTDSAAVGEWARYERALHRHEDGHAARAARAAAELADSLALVRTPSCGQLGPRLADVSRAITARYSALQAEYDEQSRHGARQGTVLRTRPAAPLDTTYHDPGP
jgi:predicted secreted Zn-dependent protease